MDIGEFLLEAGHYGPCVGVRRESGSPPLAPSGCELRTIDGARAQTLNELYDVIAAAWHFPPSFGRNLDALDDFMRDLDNMVDAALRKPPARSYLTNIDNGHLFLSKEPELFPWFAESVSIYRDYYRDDNGMYRDEDNQSAAFAVIFSVPAAELSAVWERWSTIGLQMAEVT